MKDIFGLYTHCTLCPRACGVDRVKGEAGVCRSPWVPLVAHAMLHMWEEPCISGKNGSGAVFFSGCPLGCIYCQNERISRGGAGKSYSDKELASLYLSLEKRGAENVNLVTASHYLPHIVSSVRLARKEGLKIPVVYNTSGYETVDALSLLSGVVDVYLSDLRYVRAETARRFSYAADYPTVARSALKEMVRQCPSPIFSEEGILTQGVIVRLLLLPGHLIEAKMALREVYTRYGDAVYISLMSQYTPTHPIKHEELNRRVSEAEYVSLLDYAHSLGIQNAFVQELSAASEQYIPHFDA